MKRITLLTLTLLLAVVSFAQKGTQFRPLATVQQPQLKMEGIVRQAGTPNRMKAKKKAELVTPPSSATTETWYTAGGTFKASASSGWVDYTEKMATVTVAISGSDIFIKGLAYWFPDGWIQGTISGGTATFASGQFIGEDEYGAEYIVGSDDGSTVSDNIVFTYDATEGVLTSTTKFIVESGAADEISAYCYWVSPVFSKTKPAEPEVVVPPTGLTAEEYTIVYQDYDKEDASGYVNVGFDGSDVYIQGLCSYLPEAWVKGTLSGTTVTFEGTQFYGIYGSSYKMFLQDDDVVFAYDAASQTFSAEGVVYNYTGSQYADYYTNPVITKVVEVAGTPATPTITEIRSTTSGDAVEFSIPTVDTKGNPMSSSKLSFQFFTDIEQTVAPLTFSAEDYENLEEALTVIPYGFTENWDFYDGTIYLNMEHDAWNKLGIQSIYTGGGEENKSEIFWFDIKPYGTATFDFNAMDVKTSSLDSTDGDIIEEVELVQEPVTLTVTPSGASTPNRFWASTKGPQLRVYGGTMTFEVPWNKRIVEITFNADKWNIGNTFDQPTFDGNTNTWTGEAQKVVVTVAGNSQINSITVETKDLEPTEVVVPEGLTTEPYSFKAKAIEYGDEEATDYSAQVQVGFDGDDAYIQGIAANVPEGWVKATKNADGKYVIPAHQYVGTLNYYGFFIFEYYIAAAGTGEEMTDVVLSFDATKKQFTTSQKVILHDETLAEYVTYSDVTITFIPDVAATPVDPEIDAVGFSASSYPIADFIIPAVGTKGEDLLTDKLFYTVYIEKDGEQKAYVFTAEAYSHDFEEDVTEVPYNYDGYDFYAAGERVYFEEEDEEFTSWTKVGVQSIYYGGGEVHKSNIVWKENAAATGINNVKVDTDTEKAVIYNLAGQRLQRPQKGLNIINGRKVVMK